MLLWQQTLKITCLILCLWIANLQLNDVPVILDMAPRTRLDGIVYTRVAMAVVVVVVLVMIIVIVTPVRVLSVLVVIVVRLVSIVSVTSAGPMASMSSMPPTMGVTVMMIVRRRDSFAQVRHLIPSFYPGVMSCSGCHRVATTDQVLIIRWPWRRNNSVGSDTDYPKPTTAVVRVQRWRGIKKRTLQRIAIIIVVCWRRLGRLR